MPVFEINDPQTGRTIEVEGDSPPTEQELAQIFSAIQQPQEDYLGAGIIEPARAVASGLGRTIAGGLAGTAQTLNPFAEEGAGARTVEDIQAGAFQPQTEAGREGLKTLGDLMQKGIDVVNYPISGLAGLVELVSGQGLDQAVETIKATQEKGISKQAGERIFEETGSPLAATIAETAPTAITSVIGTPVGSAIGRGAVATGKAAGRAGVAAGEGIAAGAKSAVETIIPQAERTAKSFAGRADEMFTFQTPYKKRMAEKIAEGSTDIDASKFKLAESGKVVKDRVVKGAVEQGFDEGVVAAVKGAGEADKRSMLKMVDIMEKGKKNKLFAVKNRPSDVAGDTLMSRLRAVKGANMKAGKELDGVANSLKGQVVDSSPAVNSFIDDLNSIGVGFTDDLKPVFMGSDIEGVKGAERVINQIVDRMKLTKEPDGYDMHRLKRFIDEQVTYGKATEGLAGRTEGILKNLRSNLDGILDKKFPEYDRVNTIYSDTIGAIDAFQDVAGRKMNLTGPNADKATGTLLRRTMSNAQSRVRLLDAIEEIESVANKYGVRPQTKNDLLTQVLFVDELDSVFGPVARTSFQGQIDQALKQGVNAATSKAGVIDAGLDIAGKLAEKARGINEEGAFKAIKELLKQRNN